MFIDLYILCVLFPSFCLFLYLLKGLSKSVETAEPSGVVTPPGSLGPGPSERCMNQWFAAPLIHFFFLLIYLNSIYFI